MQNIVDVVILLAWLASIPLLLRAICAINDQPRHQPGLWPHLYKLLLVLNAAGYFCIAVLAFVAAIKWGILGCALVLLSDGLVYVARMLRWLEAEAERRVDEAFDVEL